MHRLNLVPGDDGRGRSFSTHPWRRPRLSAARLALMRVRELEMTARLERLLERHAGEVALISRVGSDLSRNRFEGEAPYYTHVGIALREQHRWWVHQLLNTHGGPGGHLYRQPLVDFFRDDPYEYRVALLVPSVDLQARIASTLRSPMRLALYTHRYSRICYPYSTRYLNSNQWVAEIIAAAQTSCRSRQEAQQHLRASGYGPCVLLASGVVSQFVAGWFMRNTRFDDHPISNRLAGRLEFSMETSLRDYLRRTDSVLASLALSLKEAAGDDRLCATPAPALKSCGEQA